MKVIIQIPCLNEREHLPATFADLPRTIPGVDAIEVLIIDDGSTDGTSEVARELGVHHIVRFPRNRGLAAAYSAGLEACLRLGADAIVNTDADNQYRGDDIAQLVAPVVAGRADLIVGDRQTDKIAHFSSLKKFLQRFGSRVVRRLSGTNVTDTTSGFRALNKRAAARLFVHNRFTYTLETLIQAGQSGLLVDNVTVRTNPMTRKSRLFRSIPDYLRRNGLVILRSYAMYQPLRSFGYLAALLFTLGSGLGLRFLYYYLDNPQQSGHVQSLLVGVGAVVLSFLVALMALLGELLAANRRLLEDTLARTRGLDAAACSQARARGEAIPGVESTGAASWSANKEEAGA